MGKLYLRHGRWLALTSYSASPPTSVAFPSTSDLHQGPTVPPSPQRRQPLISFRRISLPPPPALLNRQSSASLASFDSFPDASGNAGENGSDQAFVRGPSRKLLHKQSHVGGQKQSRKRRESIKPKPHVDEHKALKRRKIITEFYDTERAYIQGLDLIYSVHEISLMNVLAARMLIASSPALFDTDH